MGWIYEISNIENGKTYIGQTTQHNVATRWGEHIKSVHTTTDTHLIRAFKSHGFEKFIFKVVCEISNEKLNEKEIEEITKRNCLSPNGYNIREGGSKGKHSQESIEKMRQSQTGKNHTEETKQKLREINLGKTLTEETKEKLRNALLGKSKTPEAIENASKARTGVKRSQEQCERIGKSREIKVEQWSIEGKYIQTYPSIKQASIETGCNDISKCCRGKFKQSGGFVWKYKDDNSSKLNEESNNPQSS